MSIARVKASSLTQGLPKRKTILAGNSTILPGSYESIQTVTVGAGGSSTITFSSIPSTYKHLQLRMLRKTLADVNPLFTFNSDSTGSYINHYIYGNGTSANAGVSSTSSTSAVMTYCGANWGAGILDILDYTNTNKTKVTRELGGADLNGSGNIILSSNLWNKTNAITSIQITTTSNFQEYSSFALYGIL